MVRDLFLPGKFRLPILGGMYYDESIQTAGFPGKEMSV